MSAKISLMVGISSILCVHISQHDRDEPYKHIISHICQQKLDHTRSDFVRIVVKLIKEELPAASCLYILSEMRVALLPIGGWDTD